MQELHEEQKKLLGENESISDSDDEWTALEDTDEKRREARSPNFGNGTENQPSEHSDGENKALQAASQNISMGFVKDDEIDSEMPRARSRNSSKSLFTDQSSRFMVR